MCSKVRCELFHVTCSRFLHERNSAFSVRVCVCGGGNTGMIIGPGGCPLSSLVTVFPTDKKIHQSESRMDDMEQTEISKT